MEDARRAAAAVEAAAGEGLAEVLLYGSVARGDQHEHSDIDLLVVFGDMDYARRETVQRRLSETASRAAGYECNVQATDLPEWTRRRAEVSSSFERAISEDTIRLVSNGPGSVNWEKEMVRPMSNEQMALIQVNRMTNRAGEFFGSAFRDESNQKKVEGLEGYYEYHRLSRLRSACADASMFIELSLKTLVVLQGKRVILEKDLRKIRHNIDKALELIDPPLRDRIRDAIDRSGISNQTISAWRVQETYLGEDREEEEAGKGKAVEHGDQNSFLEDTLDQHVEKQVDNYLHLSLSIGWTVLEEVENRIKDVPDPEGRIPLLRATLIDATNRFQSMDVRYGGPLPCGVRQGPPPQPLSSTPASEPVEAAEDDMGSQEFNEYLATVSPPRPQPAVCGQWMRLARKHCVLAQGHSGPHRSKR